MDWTALREWGGWFAAAFVGFTGFRNGRIDERIELRVQPDVIHETLGEIKETLSKIDTRTVDIGERIARVEGYLEGEKGN